MLLASFVCITITTKPHKLALKLNLNHLETEMVLPLIKSFALGSKLPKMHFLFYKHIYKAVIEEGNWKRCIAKNKRLGMAISQAFGQSTLANNYMAYGCLIIFSCILPPLS